ncbi:MAG: ABC transporter ATP-binding protein [Ignavibacterium sp.]|nr:MAG: ABC transporter ATP-binding protein [Ignavibacterium sp.]
MCEILLKAEHLFKSYKTNKDVELKVLKNVDIDIIKNKISVIVGASGAGKSTLLHLLGALDRPDSGKVFYRNENIFDLSNEWLANFRNKNIGFIFQFHHLLPEFTALENVAVPQMINGMSFSNASKKSKELLHAVGLSDRIDHKPAELSGGEQQRVAVARAFANEPDIIFGDEPTGNLDSKNSESIHQLILELREKFIMTFVIVTHNSNLVEMADNVYEIKDGKITK